MTNNINKILNGCNANEYFIQQTRNVVGIFLIAFNYHERMITKPQSIL